MNRNDRSKPIHPCPTEDEGCGGALNLGRLAQTAGRLKSRFCPPRLSMRPLRRLYLRHLFGKPSIGAGVIAAPNVATVDLGDVPVGKSQQREDDPTKPPNAGQIRGMRGRILAPTPAPSERRDDQSQLVPFLYRIR